MCVSSLPSRIYVYHAWHPQKLEEGVGFPVTGVTNGFEPPCVCQELNLDPL